MKLLLRPNQRQQEALKSITVRRATVVNILAFLWLTYWDRQS